MKHCKLHWETPLCPRKSIHTIIKVILLCLSKYPARQRTPDWAPAHTALQLFAIPKFPLLLLVQCPCLSLLLHLLTSSSIFLPWSPCLSSPPCPLYIEGLFVLSSLPQSMAFWDLGFPYSYSLSPLLKNLYSWLNLIHQNTCQKLACDAPSVLKKKLVSKCTQPSSPASCTFPFISQLTWNTSRLLPGVCICQSQVTFRYLFTDLENHLLMWFYRFFLNVRVVWCFLLALLALWIWMVSLTPHRNSPYSQSCLSYKGCWVKGKVTNVLAILMSHHSEH